jgi:hypothetical protein
MNYFPIALILLTLMFTQPVFALSAGEIETGVNNTRIAHGLAPLADNTALDASAVAKANDLCSKNYWGHFAPDGTSPWTFFYNAGYSGTALGENLAYNFFDSNDLMSAWIASPEHYFNIVGNYTEQGAAVLVCPSYQGDTNAPIAVNHFGLRMVYRPTYKPAIVPIEPTPVAPVAQVAPATPSLVQPPPSVIIKVKKPKVTDWLRELLDYGDCNSSVWSGVPYHCWNPLKDTL